MAAPTMARMIAHWVVVKDEADHDGGATAECISTGELTVLPVRLPEVVVVLPPVGGEVYVDTGWVVTPAGRVLADDTCALDATGVLDGSDAVAGWDEGLM